MGSPIARRRSAAALVRVLVFVVLSAAAAARAEGPLRTAAPAGAPSARPAAVVNINTAGAEELALLPGIGPAKAAAILAYRRARGPFLMVDELVRVPGIGPASLERLRPLCTVQGRTTATAPPRP
jgi:comEA protein